MSKGNILIVEDDNDHLLMIRKVLQEKVNVKNYYNIDAVDSASEAINYLNKSRVDLIILDLNLKDTDNLKGGFDVLEKVNKCYPRTSVIVFTGHGSVEICKQAFLNNANEFLEKPRIEPMTERYIEVVLIPRILSLLNTSEAVRWDQQKKLLKEYSEDLFISDVLVPLLTRMGFQDVKKNNFHGMGELGKDIKPFFSIDLFGERIYYAAQVKAGDIDSTAGSQNSINKLIEQIEKILIAKFYDPMGNINRKVDKALGIISGDFKGESLKIIQDKFEGRSDVSFMTGENILHLLNRYRISNLLLPASVFKIQLLEEIETDNNIFLSLGIEGTPSKIQVLQEVSNLLLRKNIVSSKDDILGPLLQREMLGSTGVGHGFASPHIYFNPSKKVFLICISEQGVDWDSLDGRRCNIICFSLCNDRDIQLKIQGFMSRYFKTGDSYKDLFVKKNREEIFNKIEDLHKKE